MLDKGYSRVWIGVLLFVSTVSIRAASTSSLDVRRTPIVEAFEKSRGAVVNIAAKQIVERRVPFSLWDELFDVPPRIRRYERTSLGSGFVIHPKGYVVTNAHVIADAADQKVVFADKSVYEAKPVAMDPQHDLAILKIESDKTFPAITLGRSHDLLIGETVIAIGNPLGYQHTVTAGIISATDRELPVKGNKSYKGLIQTDTPINPGNSGGPLLNVLGELIGINTAIRGDAQNIGFAIPVDTLHKLVPNLLSLEHHRRLAVGVWLSWRKPGLIEEASGPAAEAGIEAGDHLLRVDGRAVTQNVDFLVYLLHVEPSHELLLELDRKGKRYKTRIRPESIPIPDGKELLGRRFGLQVRLLTAREAQNLEIRGGLLVTQVESGSPADLAGVKRGMVVVQIGRYPIADLEDVGLILEHVRREEAVMFRVYEISRYGIKMLGGELIAR